MRTFGLIGHPLGHSFSQKYFSEKFRREGITDAHYELFPMSDVRQLADLLPQWPHLRGLNVTIPHKEAVLPLLDALDETARAVGAVNCIAIDNQRLVGYNTDVIGFEQSLRRVLGEVDRAVLGLVLGTGGAAKAVAFVLKKMGISPQMVSRYAQADSCITYEQVAAHVAHFRKKNPDGRVLVVNATPLGMHPQVDTCPDVPLDRLRTEDLVFDLVYNPSETLLLRRANMQGCRIQNGLEMLHLQAEAAWNIWNTPTTQQAHLT